VTHINRRQFDIKFRSTPFLLFFGVLLTFLDNLTNLTLHFGHASSTLPDFARFGMIFAPSTKMLSKMPPLPV